MPVPGRRQPGRHRSQRRASPWGAARLILAICVGSLACLAPVTAAPSAATLTPVVPMPPADFPVTAMPGSALPGAAAISTGNLPAPLPQGSDLQAKIILVNPRLSHHKGRQLRVFVRNRGNMASSRGTLRLRSRASTKPAFITESQPLPAIAPGGEASMTFSQLRHVLPLPSVSTLEAIATINGKATVLPPFSARSAPMPPSPAPAPHPLPAPVQEMAPSLVPPANPGH